MNQTKTQHLSLLGILAFMVTSLCTPSVRAQTTWYASLKIDGTTKSIPFQLQIAHQPESSPQFQAWLVNGPERILVPHVRVSPEFVRLKFPHYDSELWIKLGPDGLAALDSKNAESIDGHFRKRRGPDEWVEMKFHARQLGPPRLESPDRFAGRWRVDFESSNDPAVGVFTPRPDGRWIDGTFLTTTGDYRFLAGFVQNQTLILGCFDGAHAFRFEAKLDPEGRLQGDFWSSNTWHESWSAIVDANAKLPNAFMQTRVGSETDLAKLRFPGLDGKLVSLNDAKFAGKARLIYVFGSWCPNCHDAAAYFKELETRYADRGLSILGLAFELTGDFKRDAEQVMRYKKRHGVSYPVLIAGLSDKAKASESFPVLDRIRSYPTTLFLDQDGVIRGIHTGFAGPATGSAHAQLRRDFEAKIELILKSSR